MAMALSTSAARQQLHTICSNCRQSVLRSFIASIGTTTTPLPQRQRQRQRPFASSTRRWRQEHALNDINDAFSPENTDQRTEYVEKRRHEREAAKKAQAQDTDEIEVTGQQLQEMQELDEAIAEEKAQAIAQRKADQQAASSSEEPAEKNELHIPWYLQVQSPLDPVESTLSARQAMPPTPQHSPELLEPLLKQVSVDLGMDDLSLLDLRELDPPPALGSNLLMIIGTARSEKHLHVSADKLCRWLRSEYKLTPLADGLLGRQELKVKLRRRAKRARLMSAVGGKSNNHETELEEGIRTGWVCVNVGRVEGGELALTQEEEERESKIVGFGTRTRGCHVVVQLMTEEKRGEIGLEKLWMGMLMRSRKAKEELMKSEGEEEGLKTEEAPDIGEGVKVDGESVPFSPAFSDTPAHRHDARA